jgi:two-component system cell cycle sensor histidine kinase/response regulator CckA
LPGRGDRQSTIRAVPRESGRLSFDDVFAVMAAAAQGDPSVRVELPADPDMSDPITKIGITLNLLLDDLSFRAKEREKYEERLRQAHKLEAIGTLAGGIAHDFNNMLSVILGYTDLALQNLGPSDPVRHDLEEVREAGQRARQLTSQLLSFARQQVLQHQVQDLGQVLDGMSGMLRRLLDERIELVMPSSTPGCTIKADRGQLEQVVMNLAVNARDGMPDGGTLTLEASLVELDQSHTDEHPGLTPGPYVRLSVTDTGVGIDPKVRDRIFDPFFTTKERGRGTGLGLATVLGIVRQSGGHISVESELGHGACFSAYFPRTNEPVAPPAPSLGAPVTPRGVETVLLVEDMDQVRAVSRKILERNGYVVLEAADGEEAMTVAAAYPAEIHLLLTDVIMPRMTGPELARKLLPLRPAMKIVFMSGYTDHSEPDALLEPGSEFVQKPLTPATLLERLRRVLRRR